jgi:hypothetical protein
MAVDASRTRWHLGAPSTSMLQQQFVPIEIFFFFHTPCCCVRAFLYYRPSDFFLIPVLFWGETADAPDEGRPSDRKLHLFFSCCFIFFNSSFPSLHLFMVNSSMGKKNKVLYFRGRRSQIPVLVLFVFLPPFEFSLPSME